jgi:soluble lytic murein transglycosylase
MEAAAQEEDLEANLLRAIAKQESRFAPGVVSPAGAVGVMQLLPSTATEMAGEPTSTLMLQDPADNIQLGARYLNQLLERWENDPFRSIASYNAGPSAVASWPQPTNGEDAALWVERIPYPETRFYTKKVLDNLIGYSGGDQPSCKEVGRGVRQKRASNDAADHDSTHQE